MTDEAWKLPADQAKLGTDLVQTIATLASGSVVVLATFLGTAAQINDKGILTCGVGLLMACVLSCAIYLFLFGIATTWRKAQQPPRRSVYIGISWLVFGTFFGGMVCLSVSILRILWGFASKVPG